MKKSINKDNYPKTLHSTYHIIMHISFIDTFDGFFEFFRFLYHTNTVVNICLHSLAQSFSVTDLINTIEIKHRADDELKEFKSDLHILQSTLHYTRCIAPKRVTSAGIHLRGLAPGQHSYKETSQRWHAVGNTHPVHMSNFSGL